MQRGVQRVEGTVRRHPVSLKLGFSSDDYGYAIDLGLPSPPHSRVPSDPEITLERLWTGERLQRSTVFAERDGPMVRIRSQNGAWREVGDARAGAPVALLRPFPHRC